jgi:hypothetical protein
MGSSISLNKEQIMARKKQLQVFPTVKRPTKVQLEKMLQRILNATCDDKLSRMQRMEAMHNGTIFADLMLEMKAIDAEFYEYWTNTLRRNFNIANSREAVSHA